MLNPSKALVLAIKAHQGQYRKYTHESYIVHPIAVHDFVQLRLVALDLSYDKVSLLRCAAYLHDVLEDCPHIKEQEIIDATSVEVLNLVKELTNPSKGSNAIRSVRKQMDRDHLQHVSWEAKFLKLCDRICNLKDLAKACPDEKFKKLYCEESLLLLECLKGTNEFLENYLSFTIKELQS